MRCANVSDFAANSNNPIESRPMVANGNSSKSLYLFSHNEHSEVLNVYNNYLDDNIPANEYSIFAHGYEIGIGNYNETLQNNKYPIIENGVDVITITSLAKATEFTNALVSNKNFTLNIYACNTGYRDYTNKLGRFISAMENVAIKLSKAFPNAIINAPNGYVQYDPTKLNFNYNFKFNFNERTNIRLENCL